MELGKRIAEIRKEHSLTQEGLAEICNVTRQTISNWENGKSYPDLETLVLISDTFDVSLDVMLKGDRKMVSETTKEQKHGKHFAVKVIFAVIITALIVLGGIYYIESHESYIPYDESGITVTDNGIMYSDKTFHRYNGFQYITETVDGVHHCVVFTYLTSSIYSRHFEKQPEKKRMIENYAELKGESVDDNDNLLDDVVTEVYYLPEKYVVDQDLMNNKHPDLIPADTSEQEQKGMIEQMKADSVLLWKRK
jgi:transcriptional regulator with XRE-family HTH domain